MNTVLKINNLDFKYPKSKRMLLEKFSYNNYENNSILIVGDNGSGKSTFGKLICGLLSPEGGSIKINDNEICEQVGKNRITLASYIGQINQLQFLRNSLKGEISLTEKLSRKKLNVDSYNHFHLPDDLGTNPFELTLNETWRFSLLLASIVNSDLVFIDEVPSTSDSINMKVLDIFMKTRENKGKVTFVAYQREINQVSFNETLFYDPIRLGFYSNITEF